VKQQAYLITHIFKPPGENNSSDFVKEVYVLKKRETGSVMSRDAFLRNSGYAKEEYEGLIVSADVDKRVYNIGIELDDGNILLVDQASDTQVHSKVSEWYPRITEMQRMYFTDPEMHLR
jgi:hypothetical protein